MTVLTMIKLWFVWAFIPVVFIITLMVLAEFVLLFKEIVMNIKEKFK
jgi:hypothetical protein